MSEQKLTLSAKLAAAIQAVDRIGRDGTNTHFNYSYTSAEQVYRVIRGPLLENGLVIVPSVAESTTAGQTTITKLHLRIIDTDTGESLEAFWMGEGQDKQDKGPYKAATGGMKTWLKHLFLLPADDDPESDHVEAPRTPTKMDHLASLIQQEELSGDEKAALKSWLKVDGKVDQSNLDMAIDCLADGDKAALMIAMEFGAEEVAA